MLLINIYLITVFVVTSTLAAIFIPSKESSNLDGRIVGGVEANIEQFPHQVSLQREGKHICGAVLIRDQILLTAAHCVDEQTPEKYAARVGSSEPYKGGIIIPVKRIITHELYNEPTLLNNDIALILLAHNVTYNRAVRSIPLLISKRDLQQNVTLFVSGWGATSEENQTIASRLRYVAVKEINQGRCAHSYRYTTKITPTMICAGAENGGRDSCQGDSGGPLITSVEGSMRLVGIVSWGIGCAHHNFPGVYTRVDSYNEWLTTKIKDIDNELNKNSSKMIR